MSWLLFQLRILRRLPNLLHRILEQVILPSFVSNKEQAELSSLYF